MIDFFKSFSPILKKLKKLKKFRLEIFFISVALVIALISIVIYFKNNQEQRVDEEIGEPAAVVSSGKKYFIDIAGAVENPDVYETTSGARLKDVLILAGGLSAEADREYFSRNFNLARIITDQEKIYIPSLTEVNNGLFIESQKMLDYVSPSDSAQGETTSTANQKININSASLEELDQLPGVGKVTAQKIIQNRPYKSVEELLNKKVVNKNVYEQIKNQITL